MDYFQNTLAAIMRHPQTQHLLRGLFHREAWLITSAYFATLHILALALCCAFGLPESPTWCVITCGFSLRALSTCLGLYWGLWMLEQLGFRGEEALQEWLGVAGLDVAEPVPNMAAIDDESDSDNDQMTTQTTKIMYSLQLRSAQNSQIGGSTYLQGPPSRSARPTYWTPPIRDSRLRPYVLSEMRMIWAATSAGGLLMSVCTLVCCRECTCTAHHVCKRRGIDWDRHV
jgi:hypothetical protein